MVGLVFISWRPSDRPKGRNRQKATQRFKLAIKLIKVQAPPMHTTFFERPTTPGHRARPLFVSSPPPQIPHPPYPFFLSLLFLFLPFLQILIWGRLPPHPPLSIVWFEIDPKAACSSTNKYRTLCLAKLFSSPTTRCSASEPAARLVWLLLICS